MMQKQMRFFQADGSATGRIPTGGGPGFPSSMSETIAKKYTLAPEVAERILKFDFSKPDGMVNFSKFLGEIKASHPHLQDAKYKMTAEAGNKFQISLKNKAGDVFCVNFSLDFSKDSMEIDYSSQVRSMETDGGPITISLSGKNYILGSDGFAYISGFPQRTTDQQRQLFLGAIESHFLNFGNEFAFKKSESVSV